MSESEKALTYRAFMNREYSFKHSPFEREFEFYDCVKKGDTDGVLKVMTHLGSYGTGQLSDDPLRNLKYHFVITVALITRFCVEGGMEMEAAYTLSDLYISEADRCTKTEDIHRLHNEAVMDFTRQMNRISHGTYYSKPIIMTMDYIYDHLHSKIFESDLAEHVALSPSYLSRLFHKEVGVTLSAYIAVKRVETAQNMIKYSDYPLLDIGNYLAFTTHSHFISTFKKYTGMTPSEYRKKYYRSNWGKQSDNDKATI